MIIFIKINYTKYKILAWLSQQLISIQLDKIDKMCNNFLTPINYTKSRGFTCLRKQIVPIRLGKIGHTCKDCIIYYFSNEVQYN